MLRWVTLIWMPRRTVSQQNTAFLQDNRITFNYVAGPLSSFQMETEIKAVLPVVVSTWMSLMVWFFTTPTNHLHLFKKNKCIKKGRNVGLLLMFCIMTHTASCNLMSDKRLYFTFTRMSACRGGILIFMWKKKKSKKRYQIICEQTEKDKNKVVFRFSFYCNWK